MRVCECVCASELVNGNENNNNSIDDDDVARERVAGLAREES